MVLNITIYMTSPQDVDCAIVPKVSIIKKKLFLLDYYMSNANEDIIAKLYNDPSCHGSFQNDDNDEPKINFGTTIYNVKRLVFKNVVRKTQLKLFNRYIAPEPDFEYQIYFVYLADVEDQ